MMRRVRIAWRLGATIPWCGLAALICSLGGLFGRFGLVWKTTTGMVWARGLARIFSMRVTVTGTPPSGRFLMVSNHLSYIDIIVVLTQVRAFFVGRADLRDWPLVKWLIRASGTILIDRSKRSDVRHVNERIAAILQQGGSIALFPEATTSPGDRVYPFKSSLFDFAARNNLEVRPAAISYRTPPGEDPAHKAVVWFGDDMPFGKHVLNLATMPAFEATITFAANPIADSDRKALAQRLTDVVQSHFIPVVPPE